MSSFNISNFYIFNLSAPVFDEKSNKFIAKLVDMNQGLGHAYMKSSSLRLLGIRNNILFAEFLYSSQEFYNFIKSLDEYMKHEVIENGKEWFGEKFDADKVNNLFRPSIKLPEKLPSLPFIEFKLSDQCIIVNKELEKDYDLNDLKMDMEIKLHFCIDGVEFYKNHCNVSFSVYEIDINKNLCQTLDNLFNPVSEAINDTESEILDLAANYEDN